MQSDLFWSRLATSGWTRTGVVVRAGNRRRVMLEDAAGDVRVIDDPDDFRPDQRTAILDQFIRLNCRN